MGIGRPGLGVLTLGIRIHYRMGRKRTNYPNTSLRGICMSLQGIRKQNWHPFKNLLTFLFSLKKMYVLHCAMPVLIFGSQGPFLVHIYFCVGGGRFCYYPFPHEQKEDECGL